MKILSVDALETRAEVTTTAALGSVDIAVDAADGFLAASFVRIDDIATGVSNAFAVESVDTEADTLRLATPMPVAVSAGSLVLAINASGVAVVDHYVTLEPGDDGQTRAQISGNMFRTLGNDLIGANAVLDDAGEFVLHVTDIPNRATTPWARLTMGTNISVPNGTATGKIPDVWTTVPFVGLFNVAEEITYDGFTGVATVRRDGLYRIDTRAVFAENATGARAIRIVAQTFVGEVPYEWHLITPSSSFWPAHLALSLSIRLAQGEGFKVQVWQNSGAALDLLGGYSPPRTTLTATYGGP